ADLDGSSVLTTRYVYGPGTDEVLARSTGGANTAYLTDNIGTPRDVVNWSGAVVNHADADAFGNVTESNADPADRMGFAGGDVVEETGLVRFGARLYASNVGRWTQQDPIGFGGGDGNLYRYVGNCSINNLDPTGLEKSKTGSSNPGVVLSPQDLFG